MEFLRKQITKLGGTFEQRHVENIDAITDCDLLVNCTGLGAREFANDALVHPVRGQVIRIHNPSITQFTMIVHRDGSHTYVLPRPHGEIVVGGTVQPHNWNRENDEGDLKGVWDRACAAVPAISESKILGKHCGLRPARTLGVRLEVDPKRTASGAVVIHNYGHAGSGHTLQWGCALDVARLAVQYLGAPSTHSRL
jgi:glycine/D-amino acid oxidase-like deaminating enzyme